MLTHWLPYFLKLYSARCTIEAKSKRPTLVVIGQTASKVQKPRSCLVTLVGDQADCRANCHGISIGQKKKDNEEHLRGLLESPPDHWIVRKNSTTFASVSDILALPNIVRHRQVLSEILRFSSNI